MRGSFKDPGGHVNLELGCRGELATLLSLPKKLREILPVACDLIKAVCSFSFP